MIFGRDVTYQVHGRLVYAAIPVLKGDGLATGDFSQFDVDFAGCSSRPHIADHGAQRSLERKVRGHLIEDRIDLLTYFLNF